MARAAPVAAVAPGQPGAAPMAQPAAAAPAGGLSAGRADLLAARSRRKSDPGTMIVVMAGCGLLLVGFAVGAVFLIGGGGGDDASSSAVAERDTDEPAGDASAAAKTEIVEPLPARTPEQRMKLVKKFSAFRGKYSKGFKGLLGVEFTDAWAADNPAPQRSGPATGSAPFLHVAVSIINNSSEDTLLYRGWNVAADPDSAYAAVAQTNDGAWAKELAPTQVSLVRGARDVSLRPGDSVTDVVAFPLSQAEFTAVRAVFPFAVFDFAQTDPGDGRAGFREGARKKFLAEAIGIEITRDYLLNPEQSELAIDGGDVEPDIGAIERGIREVAGDGRPANAGPEPVRLDQDEVMTTKPAPDAAEGEQPDGPELTDDNPFPETGSVEVKEQPKDPDAPKSITELNEQFESLDGDDPE
jgi:hypothetical protein